MIQLRRFLASSLCLLAAASLAASSVVTTPTASSSDSSSSSSSSSIGSLLSQELSRTATHQISNLLLEQLQAGDDEQPQQPRQLQANEDFDEFRDLFSRAVIALPDFETSQFILFSDLKLKATNVECFDIVLQEVKLSYNLESNQRLTFRVAVNDLDLMCTLDYEWSYTFLSGSGKATIALDDNYVTTTLAFLSQDFTEFPPSSSVVENCTSDITVSDMDFSGSIADSILNVFESLLRGFVEDTVSDTVCEEMGSLGTTLVQDMIEQVAELLDPYLVALPANETNSTAAELALVVPAKVKLMDFQDEGDDQLWFYGALKEVDAALGVWLIDPNGPREGGKDLGVNIVLRENFLDKNRAFEMNVADFPFDFDPVIFEGHDQLTETTMTLDTVRVYGLDTFNEFAPFLNKGKYTLRNDLGWDFLTFEVDVTLDMKPSTLPDSIINDPGEDMHIIEKATLKIGVDDINATLSLMLAIDQDAFGALKVGALLNEDNLLPCFMASVFRSEVTVLEANVGNIRDPEIEGFIDKGIDNIVTQAVNAAFLMYESVVIKAMPSIFQTTVKDVINEAFFLTYDESCPEPKQTEGFIDFRDLLAGAEDSLALGGSGTEPYGGIAPTLFNFLKRQIATVENDGTLSANDMFIRPLTKDQSGVDGMVHFPGDLFKVNASDINMAGVDELLKGFSFSLSDVRALNLDTLVPPFDFLQPTTDPHALDNEVHMGPVVGRPINVSAHLALVFGDDSPLAMNNNVKIGMTSSAFEILAEFVARIDAMSLMNFPIKDLLDYQCWLATMPAPALNELGLRVDADEERGIELTEFANKFSDLNLTVECTNCTSGGLDMLPTVLGLLKETDVTSVLASRMKFLVNDLVVSDTFQTLLDRMLEDASKSCPHSPAFTTDKQSIEAYAELPLPGLSATSIDTVQFVLGTVVQTGFVIFTQLYAETEINPADPLINQNSFEVPEGSNLIDFMDFKIGLPSFLDSALDNVLKMVNGTGVDPATGVEDLSINIFIRDLLDGGVLDLDLEGLSFGPDEIELEFHNLRVEGLDSFKKFDVGVPVAPQTILNEIEMGTIALELDFSLRSGDDSQRIQVAFRFDDLSASIPLFAAIDMALFKNIQFGSLLRFSNMIPCLLSSVYGFSFPNMVVNVGKIYKPSMKGLMPETSASLTTLVDTLFMRYETSMHESLPSVVDNAIRPIVNTMLDYFVSGSGSGKSCTNPLLNSLAASRKLMQVAGPPFVDFRDLLMLEEDSVKLGGRGDSRYGDVISFVWRLIEEEFLAIDASGISPVNSDIIGALTEPDSPGDLYFPGDLLNTDFELALGPIPTGIAFRVSDVRVENLDSIGNPFSLLDPVNDARSVLNNTATIGVGQPLRMGVNLFVDISTEGTSIRNDFDISADLQTATLVLTALLKISEYRFAAFPLGDFFNLDCWMATLPPPALDAYGVRVADVEATAALEDLMVSMQKLDLNITCRDCSSPGLEDLADLWSTPEATADITNAANDLLEYLADVLGNGLVQTEVDRMLNNAAKRCPHSPEYNKDFSSFTFESFKIESDDSSEVSLAILVMVVGSSFIGALGVLVFIIRFITRRRHGRWLKTLPSNQLILLKQRQEKTEEKEAELNAMTQSMFMSCDVPLWVRWTIPLIILGNIGFFLSGHLSLGAEVKIQVSFAGQVMTIEQFYQFSMASSTVEIWEAGGKALAALILIFSGIWPYTKQLITLVLWFLPTSRCSISRRGSILLWLDTLAKWSIVDIFTLVMSVAAFRVSVQSPNLGFLTDDLYSLDLLVVPMWGLYANLIAQLISQVSSHFIIHYHRNIVHQATKVFRQNHGLVAASTHNLALTESSEASDDSRVDDPYGDRKDLLNTHAYARPHRGESGKLVARSYVNGLLVIGALVFVVLMFAGCAVPSSGLEFQGVIGVAVESGQDWKEAVTSLSLFDLVNLLMDQARFTGEAVDVLGLGFLSALLITTVLLVPLAQTAAIMYQWFVPMAGRSRKRMSILVEILQAWQYAEVYVISIIVATWQLGPISTFMINSYCNGFQETFDLLAYFGILSNDDAQCFRVDASIQAGSYILAAAALLLALLNTFVMNAAKQYFRDRDESITRAEWKERNFAHAQTMESTSPSKASKDRVQGSDEESELYSEEDTPSAEQMGGDFEKGRSDTEASIKPVPVLFTDKFRWVLCASNDNAAEDFDGAEPLSPVGEFPEQPESAFDREQPTSSSDTRMPAADASVLTDGEDYTDCSLKYEFST